MSYDIVYKRQFLKVDNKIIPLVLIGCNNVWENAYHRRNNQRRVRNWNPIMNPCNAVPLMTADEIMDKAQTWTGGKYQEHFKWNSKWVDDKTLLTFFKNGIKGAASLEELQELSYNPDAVYLKCHLSIWYKDEIGEQRNKNEMFKTVRTTEELLAYMKEVSKRLADRLPNETSIYICLEFPYEKAVQYTKAGPVCRKKPERLDSNFWVILAKRTGAVDYYISKLTARKLHFSYTRDAAKQFKSQAAAEKWATDKHIKNRFVRVEGFEYQHVA